jgi:hypothetical protein
MLVQEGDKLNNVSIMGDGIRYRKKRKHNELIIADNNGGNNVNNNRNKENILEDELADNVGIGIGIRNDVGSKGKKFKFSKKEEEQIGLSKRINAGLKVSQQDVNKEVDLEKEKNKTKSKIIDDNEENIPNNKKNNFPPKALPSDENENKKILKFEHERVKSTLSKIEEKFNKEHIPTMINAINLYCKKNAKNKSIKLKGNH